MTVLIILQKPKVHINLGWVSAGSMTDIHWLMICFSLSYLTESLGRSHWLLFLSQTCHCFQGLIDGPGWSHSASAAGPQSPGKSPQSVGEISEDMSRIRITMFSFTNQRCWKKNMFIANMALVTNHRPKASVCNFYKSHFYIFVKTITMLWQSFIREIICENKRNPIRARLVSIAAHDRG